MGLVFKKCRRESLSVDSLRASSSKFLETELRRLKVAGCTSQEGGDE